MNNANLYFALRQAFPVDLDTWALETETGLVYTWRDLERGSAMMANLLSGLGLPAGARVAVQTEKSAEALMLYLATLRAGLVYLPLNTAYQEAELEYFVGNAEPSVFVCSPDRFSRVSTMAFRTGVGHVFTLGDNRRGSLLDRAAQCSDQQSPAWATPDTLAAILYTSGTTGRSKGAMLTHGNLLSNARTLKEYWDWRPDDVLIHALPIFHVHGLFVACHGALINGSPMLWLSSFDPSAVIDRLPRATVFMGVPTLYVRLLQQRTLTREVCRHMRVFISGSAPLLIETFREFQTRTGHTILERYGMSETIMLTSNPCRTSDGRRKGGTVGPALPGVGVRVVDEQGLRLPAGEIGNVEVSGPNVFRGYWRMPERTAEEFSADGWFKTGDVGHLDADRYLTIVGRSKDLIISGGYNVYPAEVEGYLNELPGVLESAVVGVPHSDFGEGVIAFLVCGSGSELSEKEVISAIKLKIANFKVPKRVLFLEELPRNAMGKVQKAELRRAHNSLLTSA